MSELEQEGNLVDNLKIINTNISLIIQLLKDNKTESSNIEVPLELEEQGYEILDKKIFKEYSKLFPELLLKKRIDVEYNRVIEQPE